MTDVRYWIWLSSALPAASSALHPLLERFGDPKAVFAASEEEILSCGVSESIAKSLADKSTSETSEIYKYCTRNNVGFIAYDDPAYPERLRRIENPPALLYFKGNFPDIDKNVCIAAVGTRRITEYGRREAYTICFDLALGGAYIISGLARGIDSTCHSACIDASGTTVAVLGCGIDVVYPRENASLYTDVMAHGAVITEFKPGTAPLGANFPKRNRIISALSLGTLVLEADEHSGALITAELAKKQGKDLFALPGKVGELNSTGTNKLLKEGAKIVTGAVDILEEYELLFPHRIKTERIRSVSSRRDVMQIMASSKTLPSPSGKREDETKEAADGASFAPKEAKRAKPRSSVDKGADKEAPEAPGPGRDADLSALDPTSRKVYEAMPENKAVLVDELVGNGLSVSEILVSMTMLEISGLIRTAPGGKYIKVNP